MLFLAQPIKKPLNVPDFPIITVDCDNSGFKMFELMRYIYSHNTNTIVTFHNGLGFLNKNCVY